MSAASRNARTARASAASAAKRPASNLIDATAGATARQLNPTAAAPAVAPARRVRTPLSIVTSPVRRRRAPLVVMSLLTLMAALVGVLLLNISVSSGQYELVALRNQQNDLQKTNQGLTQQVQKAQAPQNLAAKARELGMVQAATQGQINVDNGTVAGIPTPAPEAKDQPALIPPASLTADNGIQKPANQDPAAQAKDSSKQADGNKSADTKEASAAVPQQKAPVDMHGGSVPSPVQKVPGQ